MDMLDCNAADVYAPMTRYTMTKAVNNSYKLHAVL